MHLASYQNKQQRSFSIPIETVCPSDAAPSPTVFTEHIEVYKRPVTTQKLRCSALSSLLCYVDIDHSDCCFRRYLLHNLSLPELLCRRSSVVVASESDSWLQVGGLGWLPPHSAARESTTQLAWVQLSLVAAAWLARAATSSTALHWVESRHCTALH